MMSWARTSQFGLDRRAVPKAEQERRAEAMLERVRWQEARGNAVD